jgi:hypothetical protein
MTVDIAAVVIVAASVVVIESNPVFDMIMTSLAFLLSLLPISLVTSYSLFLIFIENSFTVTGVDDVVTFPFSLIVLLFGGVGVDDIVIDIGRLVCVLVDI